MLDSVTWIFGVGVVLSVLVGYGLGANDVANMFGPSVGSRALTMRQALLVACVFEFLGAVLMGSGVAETIRSGITNIDYFYPQPEVLAYGMLCALAGTGVWMMIATYYGLPVSSTQAIVASIAGMAIVAEGWTAVVWSAPKKSFPYLSGMSAIALSWLFSPILAGGFSFLLFWAIRGLVLRRRNAYERSIYLLPAFTLITFFTVTWFIIAKGGPHYAWQNTPDATKAWISAVVAVGACLVSIFVGIPLLRRSVRLDLEADAAAAKGADADVGAAGGGGRGARALAAVRGSAAWKTLNYGLDYDIHKVIETDARVAEIHSSAEVFDRQAELSFKYLQVCTACANAFAHGSNEVANAIGPLAAIYQARGAEGVWRDSEVSAKNQVPSWLLAIGGAAICIGLATFGYRVMQNMGVKMTRLTNSRGFCVEICVAAVVIIASRFGLPMSSTPATVGAIAGVGLWEGRAGFNGRLFAKFVAGWIVTIIAAVALTCAFMAQGLYSPSKTCTAERIQAASYLNGTSNAVSEALAAAGGALGNATWSAQAQDLTALTASQQMPVNSLDGPLSTQGLALSYLANATAALMQRQ
ncbi:MAG: phosphate transporter family-domain-containing protein [Monoraphidium minutum]|nr:MAG: phosphate transporter family-domain-containing protein [Monoraphidium minutum]